MSFSSIYQRQYKEIRDKQDNYIKKSRTSRMIKNIGIYSLWYVVLYLLGAGIFKITPPSAPYPYELTLDNIMSYAFYLASISLFFGPLFLLIGDILINRVKKDCNYYGIKKEIIPLYESEIFIEKYLSDLKATTYKKDAILKINEAFKIIAKWEINLPFIKKDTFENIKFIQNDLKKVIIKLIKSKEQNDITKSLSIIDRLMRLLDEENLDKINDLSIEAKSFTEKTTLLIEVQKTLSYYVQKNKALSQIIFTIIFIIIIYYIGLYTNVQPTILYGVVVGAIGVSYVIFKWIKEDVLNIS
jgi:hypothetical protein